MRATTTHGERVTLDITGWSGADIGRASELLQLWAMTENEGQTGYLTSITKLNWTDTSRIDPITLRQDEQLFRLQFERGFGLNTRKTYIKNLNTYFIWLYRNHIIEVNNVGRIERGRERAKEMPCLHKAEIDRLLAHLATRPYSTTVERSRNQLMIDILRFSGIRPCELLDLTTGAIYREAAFVTAIIMQAYRDLFVNVNTDSGNSFTSRTDQDQAIAFLTDQTGRFAAHRNHLCSLIGWDGNVLAARVRRMMEGDDFPIANGDSTPTAIHRHRQSVESLRQRYRYLKNPHALPASPVGHPQVA